MSFDLSHNAHQPATGTVYFVGAGPGAPDLITVRGQGIIAQADLIVYADSLVQESVAHLARKPAARVVGSSGLHLEQIVAQMAEAARAGGIVARVHTGDPALYGAIQEQMALMDAQGVPYEVVPGVTAAFAAAARLGAELTLPDVVQTLIFSRIAGRTPVPEREALPTLAAHGASLALYLSISQIERVVADLLAGGAYTPDTPAAVVHKVTWPDESIVTGTLADIAARVRDAGYTRHALILVSPALAPALQGAQPGSSRLYDKSFAHGFRRAETRAAGQQAEGPVIIAVTRQGSALAARLAPQLGAALALPQRFAQAENQPTAGYTGPVAAEIARCWARHRQLVLVMSSGIAVRAIAPLLGDKRSDPAVICLDEAGQAVIPLLGGHQAGANALAQRIAAVTGGTAAITTASDVQHRPALDLLGQEAGWRIDAASALTHASACLVNDEPLGVYIDPALPGIRQQAAETWLAQADNLALVEHLDDLHSYAAGLIISHRLLTPDQQALLQKSVLYRPPVLTVGLGCRRGASSAELHAALEQTLAEAHLAAESIGKLATADLKADEPGLHALAELLGLPLHLVEQERLAALAPDGFSPSAAREKFGLPGVAEPCALLAAGTGGSLLLPKRSFPACTVAVALTDSGAAQPQDSAAAGSLALVSIGPGDPQQMTAAAREALRTAEYIIGYQSYIEQVRPLLAPGQEVIARPMKSEMERAGQALELAAAGRRVALISSGDIGLYAMAGPVFEALQQRGWQGHSPSVSVLPGISAFQAAAARLGAAISHDTCTISLSDLLTPWEVIEPRLWAAAEGDFVIAFYNPRSRERTWQLERAREILLTCRPPDTPVALARNVMRPDEHLTLTTLAELDTQQADMLTVVLVGNSQSYRMGRYLVTPRGYEARRSGLWPAPEERAASQAQDQMAGQHEPQPAATYPINLAHMQGAAVLVVGGGAVGERKIGGLLAVQACITLISPQATPRLREWAQQGRIEWQQQPYQAGSIAERQGTRPLLVFAATSERRVNAQVAQEAAALGILCNVADAPAEGSFHLPAVHRGDGLVIAVSSEGTSPARSRQVRDRIVELLNTEIHTSL